MSLDFSNVLSKEKRFFYMGIAMIAIVGFHLYLHDLDLYTNSCKAVKLLFKNGYVGVDIFLFFSAFGLCHSYVNSSLGNFYKKRFIRIVPIYLLFAFCFYFLWNIDESNFISFLRDRFLEVTSLSIIHTAYTCPEHLRLAWFVPAIVNLYIMFPLFFKLIRKIYMGGKNDILYNTIYSCYAFLVGGRNYTCSLLI